MKKLIYAIITVVCIVLMYPIEGDDLKKLDANRIMVAVGE